MLAQKTRIFYYVHKPKQPTALIYFKRLASRVRCSFCKGVFNLCYTTLLGLKGNMCLRRMSVSRSKRLNKEIPDRCWRKDRKSHCELFSVFIIHSLTCFMQANLVPFWFWLVQVRLSSNKWFGDSITPRVCAIVGIIRVESVIAAREIKKTPSPKESCNSWATCKARLVLPTPPGPV